MYIVLTTMPKQGSGNVGDLLIELSLRELVTRETGEREFVTFFREEPLDAHLDLIAQAKAVLMPGFAIRDLPMTPGCYQLVDDWSRIRTPLVPVGANYNVYPGDAVTREQVTYSPGTRAFLEYVSRQYPTVSCRERHTLRVLARQGITNTAMTGDPAWFDPACFGQPMRRPREVCKVVFTPPLSPFYADQAEAMMRVIAEVFPAAQRYCAFHMADADALPQLRREGAIDDGDGELAERSAAMSQAVLAKNRRVRTWCRELGFEVREASFDLGRIAFYGDCDLHVGYECHAHLYFLRKRIPSLLIHEDARGVGFTDTMGGMGVNGFRRQTQSVSMARKAVTSGYCTSPEEYQTAPCDPGAPERVRRLLNEELASGFRRCSEIGQFIDEIYRTAMGPFLRALPR